MAPPFNLLMTEIKVMAPEKDFEKIPEAAIV